MFKWFTDLFKREKPQYDTKSLSFAILEAKLAYPSLYGSTDHVLNHLYLVIGNGYDWVDGRLEISYDDEKHKLVRRMLLDGVSEAKIAKKIAKLDYQAWDEKYGAEDRERLKRLSKEQRKLYEEMGLTFSYRPMKPPTTIHPYPICEYSALWDITPDAKPDWVAGAYDAARLAVVYDSYDDGRTESNIQWTVKAVERLDRMFGCLHRPKRS